ncbi:DEAD/DEAH box helicase domain-containing protein [Cardiosporidium cionae]|uniref:DEAD/DEAH box helicase domain-containing protein n=1 Tax=Cardiosporidium cionae TaxID=476202 RepID=A0ABQ7JAD3_9APIC|nr:DEAD/DEAH box helicase domain-containing protein [Cardiosporidium cionae]|eukprot:KAF8820963.1 DEAD/DEAH box helicase domain-containing protein [Cardiosporidium cionae]
MLCSMQSFHSFALLLGKNVKAGVILLQKASNGSISTITSERCCFQFVNAEGRRFLRKSATASSFEKKPIDSGKKHDINKLLNYPPHLEDDQSDVTIMKSSDATKNTPSNSLSFSSNSVEKSNSKSKQFSVESTFFKYPFYQGLLSCVVRIGIATPTEIQELAIPRILNGQSVMIVGQTGSGKTLAYLLPILQRLHDDDIDKLAPYPHKPRVVIVVPTRELAAQLLRVIRDFPITSTACTAGLSYVKETQILRNGVDIVIATPARLLLHLKKGNVTLSMLKHFVVEEADALCDTFFEQDLLLVLQKLPNSKVETPQNIEKNDQIVEFNRRTDQLPKKFPQLTFVLATRTGAVSNFCKRYVQADVLLNIVAADSHMVVPTVFQSFVPLYGVNRLSKLQESLQELQGEKSKILVFCNTMQSCRAVDWYLTERGYRVSSLHSEMPYRKRRESFEAFKSSESSILVATNLASRGLDIPDIKHVIMFDFPQNMAEYLHRAGRTGRGGDAGTVTSFYNKRNMPLIKSIKEASRSGLPIDVRNATEKVKKILSLEEKWQLKVSLRNRTKKIGGRKAAGAPPRRGTVSPETKKYLKKQHFRAKTAKLVLLLRKRGILKANEGIPKYPDKYVELSDSQESMHLKKNKDGHLQLISRRRKPRNAVESSKYETDAEAIVIKGGSTYAQETTDRKLKHHARTMF